MNNWQDLVGGSADDMTSDMFWNGLLGLAILGAIVGFVLMMRSRGPTEMPAKVAYESIDNLADPMIVADGRPESTHVRPKNASRGIWATPVDETGEMPMADEFYGYSKFQQAILSGVERDVNVVSTMKVHSQKDLEAWNLQLQPLRETLTRANKTLAQWIDENNVQLPDDVTEMWESVKNMKPVVREDFNVSNVSAEEAASIVRDVIQSIPTANVDTASMILREVLHARSQAQSLNLTIPPLSLEQLRILEFWKASAQVPACDLASKILSRQ